MGAAAAGDLGLIRAMGRASAREATAVGCNWAFAPVVDLAMNPENPITNIRSLGDNPGHVARAVRAFISGLQEDGLMAATAKHFPGDGMDDRDQHICTSVNPLSPNDWRRTYGRVWRAAIDVGVMSIMVGHIELPAFEGCEAGKAPPATLSRRVQEALLRGELGFRGVIASDAAQMIGLRSRVRSDEKALQNILAGSDIHLHADPQRDFAQLMAAVADGRLPMARVDASVRRVLEMKARLNLHLRRRTAPLDRRTAARIRTTAREMAEKSVTLLRRDANTPVRLMSGARVLTVTLRHEKRNDPNVLLPGVDAALRRRGFRVAHLDRPSSSDLLAQAGRYEAVFVNIVTYPHQECGTMRLTWGMAEPLWEAFWVEHPTVIFTSFGSPYIGYELPHIPNLYVTYGFAPCCQEAAVKAWLGEIPAAGRCPVSLVRPPVNLAPRPGSTKTKGR
jgi:beta-N-acetylhexosaminidase